ncbi:MAG TPA: PVC-type heme-binding CxxCH protein, partial [Gemmataceae bacterium]|nr:PVC-type heme-binding CxxCH protein [Gemmataceae bacterium]
MRRLLIGVLSVLFVSLPFAKAADEGVLPVGADGKPLNFDFETGTLKDWTAEGDAFKNQPIKGDTVHPRRGDMYSRHQGQYWIGGFERFGDKPTGTLTSVPFKVTHRWASFLVGGGPWKETCVELLHEKEVFHRASGMEEEDMRREVVDLIKYMGKEIQIRLVDNHTGHWGHINFDDFRFHAEKPSFPARPKKAAPGPMDVYKNAGLTPEKAAAAMTVPEDFKVTLFAGEPDVMQPIAFAIDDRGRLWVAEAFIYPKRHPSPGPLLPEAERKKGDRIVIFEDTDGDGKFDKKTTFIEGLNLVSGIEIGFGGVWVGAAPYLLYIPILEGDKPGDIKILLDGWHYEDTHETLNTFCWGPDGWLYGCHGVFTHSRVGKPGTPDEQRIPINAGIWRYHPTKHVFEIFAEGTSNPWGLDYNENGEFFIEACVIPHCFHIIQGARYLRQAGNHFNPYTYADIGTIADHLHYVGATPHGGNNRSDSAGGGHAHCGLMCYLGGAWPEKYKGQLFMGNIHGRRINMDILKPKGSGYVASHGPDFLLANDEWARFINLKYGPDGNVYLIDWYDKQACHLPQPEVWDRTNGRIYKISYRGTKPVTGIDLQKCTDEELVKYQLHENEWYARHARRVLQERAAKADDHQAYGEKIAKLCGDLPIEKRNVVINLRVLLAIHASGGLNLPDVMQSWLATEDEDKDEIERSWLI